MFQRIVVPLDGSCLAEWALPHAINLARAFDIPLVLIRVTQNVRDQSSQYPPDPVVLDAIQAEASAYLDAIASRLASFELDLVTATLEGDAVDQIIDFVRSGGRTLLVMTSHGVGGVSHYMLGSVAHKSILQAHVSFLLVRAFNDQCGALEEYHYNRLVVPLDGGRRSECVLPIVEMLARHNECALNLVSIVPSLASQYDISPDDSRMTVIKSLEEQQRKRLETYVVSISDRLKNEGLRVETRVETRDSPIAAIWQLTRKGCADLVVMAAHGQGCVNHWPLGALPLNAMVYGETPLLVLQDLDPNEIELTLVEKVSRERRGH